MSSTDITATAPLSGNLPNARQFPEIVNGWTRTTAWVDGDAGQSCGDYAVGPCLNVYYEKVLPNGRVLAVETVTYMEVRPDEADWTEHPEADLFVTGRDFFHTAPDRQRFDGQWYDVEDYEYVPHDFFRTLNLADGEVKPEDAWWLLRTFDQDDREMLLWEGEPIRR